MRTLSIGTDIPSATASRRWTDEYNLKDYRVTFANLRDIEFADNIMTPMSKASVAVQFPSRSDILQYCKNGNDIYVILPSERNTELQHITNEEHERKEVDLLNWLPFDIALETDRGESVDEETVAANWSWYFNEPFDREYVVERVGKYPREESSPSQVFQDLLITALPQKISLAETLSGDTIGAAIDLTPFGEAYKNQTNGKPGTWDGRVYLLPLEASTSAQTLVKGVLRHRYDSNIGNEDRPDWITNTPLEYEDELVQALQKKHQRLQEIRHFKELWWAADERLEDRVIEALQLLGAQVSQTEEQGLWDGILEYQDTVFVLEVTGSESGISITKMRQLQDWASRVASNQPESDVTGLLIGNPQRTTHPHKRVNPLTEAAVEHLQQSENEFLKTGELLGAVITYLRGDPPKESVLEELLEGHCR